MKTSDVPQDESVLGEHRRACYAVDQNGQYVIVPSKGWEVEKVVNALAADDVRHHTDRVRQQVVAGQLSPLAYHMARCQMNTSLLAANTGIFRWRVSRHLQPKHFQNLKPAVLEKYAYALGVSVETLCQQPQD